MRRAWSGVSSWLSLWRAVESTRMAASRSQSQPTGVSTQDLSPTSAGIIPCFFHFVLSSTFSHLWGYKKEKKEWVPYSLFAIIWTKLQSGLHSKWSHLVGIFNQKTNKTLRTFWWHKKGENNWPGYKNLCE